MVFFYSANFSSFPQNVSHLSVQTVNEWKKKKKKTFNRTKLWWQEGMGIIANYIVW